MCVSASVFPHRLSDCFLPAGDLREAEGAAGSRAEDGLINLNNDPHPNKATLQECRDEHVVEKILAAYAAASAATLTLTLSLCCWKERDSQTLTLNKGHL